MESKIDALTQQMSMVLSRLRAGQPGQQQRPPTSAPVQTSAPQQPIHRPSGATYNQHQQFFCYECGAPGHIARNCERRRQATSQGPNQPPDRVRTTRQHSYAASFRGNSFELGGRLQTRRTRGKIVSAVEDEDHAPSRVCLPMRIAGKNFGALLDTGCEITVIPTKLVRRRQLQYTT